MSKSLVSRIFEDSLLWQVCKIVSYAGFPFRELAAKMKPLADQYGVRKVSAALSELCGHVGWRTMLTPQARTACWGVLGPPPEKWDTYYTDAFGKPTPRPPEHQTPPVIPPPQPDPFLESLTRLVYAELAQKLQDARKRMDASDAAAVASEMLRRGMDIPAPEAAQEKSTKRPRKKKV